MEEKSVRVTRLGLKKLTEWAEEDRSLCDLNDEEINILKNAVKYLEKIEMIEKEDGGLDDK